MLVLSIMLIASDKNIYNEALDKVEFNTRKSIVSLEST